MWWITFCALLLTFLSSGALLFVHVFSPKQEVAQTIRNFFSQTQTIKVLPPSLGGKTTLNLDNVATLTLHVPYSEQSVTLLLDVVPVELPPISEKSFKVEGVQIYNQSTGLEYTFDTKENRRKEISISGRNFVVTLLKIQKLDVPNVSFGIQYDFGISEK